MEQVDVDRVAAEPAQAALDRAGADTRPRTASARRRPRAASRRCRCRPCCRRARRPRPAERVGDQLLAVAVPVDVGRVDQRDARGKRRADGGDRRPSSAPPHSSPPNAQVPIASSETSTPVVRGVACASGEHPGLVGEARCDEHQQVADHRRRHRHDRPPAPVVEKMRRRSPRTRRSGRHRRRGKHAAGEHRQRRHDLERLARRAPERGDARARGQQPRDAAQRQQLDAISAAPATAAIAGFGVR